MQVLSSRSIISNHSVSTSKPKRKGLSLTSKDNYSTSLPKPSSSFCSNQTLQTQPYSKRQIQTSIKFDNIKPISQLTQTNIQLPMNFPQSFISNKNSNELVNKSINQMPRITFRYTNQQAQPVRFVNPFSVQPLLSQPVVEPVRNRFISSKEMRQVVMKRSVQTKKLSKSKFTQQNILIPKSSKVLIDSRRVDRQIVQQKLYKNIPNIIRNKSIEIRLPSNKIETERQKFKQLKNEVNVKWEQQKRDKYEIVISKIENRFESKQIIKNEQNKQTKMEVSPYHLLISSVKQHQHIEMSQIEQKQTKQVVQQKVQEQKLPLIQQFTAQAIYNNEVINKVNKQIGDHIIQQLPFTKQSKAQNVPQSRQDCRFITKNPVNTQTQQSNQTIQLNNINCQTSNLQIHQQQTIILSNVNFNSNNLLASNQIQQKPSELFSKDNQNQNQMIKQSLPLKTIQKIENISNIQNKPPSNNLTSMSGKRNIRRIKQIQKRLQEIINICNHNL